MDLPLAAHLLVRTVGIHKAFVPFFCWEKLGVQHGLTNKMIWIQPLIFFCRCDQQNNYITRPKPKWTGLVRNFSGLNISFFEVAMSISSSSSARYVLKSSLQFHWARKKLLKQGPPSIPLRSKRAVGFPSSLETHPTQTRSKLRHLKCFSPAFSMGAPQFSSNLPVCPVAGRGQ